MVRAGRGFSTGARGLGARQRGEREVRVDEGDGHIHRRRTTSTFEHVESAKYPPVFRDNASDVGFVSARRITLLRLGGLGNTTPEWPR